MLVDLSMRGARIRHTVPVSRGASVRVSFTWGGVRFSSDAEVLASRMVSLGAAMSYQSRVRFRFLDHQSEKVLERALKEIAERDRRGNLPGWNVTRLERAPAANSFIRCRLFGSWWETKITNDRTQPENGFVLRAETAESEVETLRRNYSGSDEAAREMIRVLASEALAEDAKAHRDSP